MTSPLVPIAAPQPTQCMRILALNPFHGGSHRAFLDGWVAHSRHTFTVLSLPARKWKWRMRHAAVTLAGEARRLIERGERFDALFCTDMLNLAEFIGLGPPAVQQLPRVAYFHENQLTYPVRAPSERDLHFACTNLTTALAASQVWFNSEFHRGEFLAALADWLPRMPDFRPVEAVAHIRGKSHVYSPGVDPFPARCNRSPGPPRILWAARWEHDKHPADFFEALYRLADAGCEFRVSVLGEAYGETPECFAEARSCLGDRIDHWGWLPGRDAYRQALLQSDIVVSTAGHEFFGIAVVEAVAAGCFPLAPRRLAYPEVLGDCEEFFYDGTLPDLVDRLRLPIDRIATGRLWEGDAQAGRRIVQRYHWRAVAAEMDAGMQSLCLPAG